MDDIWDLLGDPTDYGMDTSWMIPDDATAMGLTQSDWDNLMQYNNGLDSGSGGELNAGFGGGGTALSNPVNFGASQGSNFSGTADPMGGFTMDQLNQLANASGSNSFLQTLGRMLGGGKNPTLGSTAAGMIPLLLGGLGGYLTHNATQDATAQTVAGINSASDQAKQLISGAQANYAPYMSAGGTALSKLAAMPPSNIAGNFAPLGSGRQLSNAPRSGNIGHG